jgi:hypothetical protein
LTFHEHAKVQILRQDVAPPDTIPALVEGL